MQSTYIRVKKDTLSFFCMKSNGIDNRKSKCLCHMLTKQDYDFGIDFSDDPEFNDHFDMFYPCKGFQAADNYDDNDMEICLHHVALIETNKHMYKMIFINMNQFVPETDDFSSEFAKWLRMELYDSTGYDKLFVIANISVLMDDSSIHQIDLMIRIFVSKCIFIYDWSDEYNYNSESGYEYHTCGSMTATKLLSPKHIEHGFLEIIVGDQTNALYKIPSNADIEQYLVDNVIKNIEEATYLLNKQNTQNGCIRLYEIYYVLKDFPTDLSVFSIISNNVAYKTYNNKNGLLKNLMKEHIIRSIPVKIHETLEQIKLLLFDY